MLRSQFLNFALFIVIHFAIDAVVTVNIDTEFPIKFQGEPRSYFGYSVSLLRNRAGPWLIVGAPKANSTQVNAKEPGEIYKCLVKDNNGSSYCDILKMENTDFSGSNRERGMYYSEVKDFGWLGVSVDTTSADSGRVVACGHRWINKYYNKQYFVNGACYTIDGEFTEDSMERHLPLIRGEDQQYSKGGFKYAYAQMGISAHFVKDTDTLLLGAPGIFDWKGSLVHLSRAEPGIVHKRSTLRTYGAPTVPETLNNVQYSAYMGYAMTSGKFAGNGVVQYVIGAPRQDYRGQVFIVELVNSAFVIKVDKKGEQMGEYFGSSICAVNFDGDEFDDLLVGAPFHSKEIDEGKVYVYNNKGSIHLQMASELMGSTIPNARFGSSIANIGDINMDGYHDVAIGAPYENGQGAVYIYHGGPKGLNVQFKQKITAAQANTNARGFGVAISRGMDVDNNFYSDIVVGAYDSAQAFLFRSRPLIKITGRLIPDKDKLDVETKQCFENGIKAFCFKVRACLRYTGEHVPSSISVKGTFEVDTLKGSNVSDTRVVVKDNSKRSADAIRIFKLQKDQENCTEFEMYVKEPLYDYLTPIQMRLSYEMVTEKPSKKGFCSTCPMVDQSDGKAVLTTVRFLTKCGDDEKCDADLKLKASFKDFGHGSQLTIGSQNTLILQAEIHNSLEPAYVTTLRVQMPHWMDINKKPPTCDFTTHEKPDSRLLICLVANPLKQNHNATMELILNLQRIPVHDGEIDVIATVTSDSRETGKEGDNSVQLILPVSVEADVYVIGSTDSEQALYYHDDKGALASGTTTNFSHSFEISNNGPSPIELVEIEVLYPSPLASDDSKIIQISDINRRNGQRGGEFGSCDGALETVTPTQSSSRSAEELTPRHVRRRRRQDVNEEQLAINDTDSSGGQGGESRPKESFYLNCTTVHCESFRCAVGPFEKDTRATLTVTFTVDILKLRTFMGKLDTAVFVTEGKVVIRGSTKNVQPFDHKADHTSVTTEIKPGGPPLAKELASWIIPVCVVCGLLLLALIVLGLYKAGFFHRQKKEDMEKLKEGGSDDTGSGRADQSSALMDT